MVNSEVGHVVHCILLPELTFFFSPGELSLGNPQDYFYTSQGNSYQVDGIDDVQEFRDCTVSNRASWIVF